MRPRTLDEFVGQEHIVGPGRLLRRAIQADQLGSLIFYGPPGTGKTTLARVIANTTQAHFIALNAVLAGVKEIREAVAEAQERAQAPRPAHDPVRRRGAPLQQGPAGRAAALGRERHRHPRRRHHREPLLRGQQGAGQPQPHLPAPAADRRSDLRAVVHSALGRPRARLRRASTSILDDDALEHLVDVANGDARGVLNALELAVETTEPARLNGRPAIHIALDDRRRVDPAPRGALRQGGRLPLRHHQRLHQEPARQRPRRGPLLDGQDGLRRRESRASSSGACSSSPARTWAWPTPAPCRWWWPAPQAFEQVGLPEGRFPLAQAALYLATAPKSNTHLAFFDALAAVEHEADSGVPNHLRDASRDAEGLRPRRGLSLSPRLPGPLGRPAVSAHIAPGQGLLPAVGPGLRGGASATQVARRREAQLAAMLEAERRRRGWRS